MRPSECAGRAFSQTGRKWQARWELIGDVRGLGAMQALELVRSKATREPANEETKQVAQYCYEHGLVLITAGSYSNVIRLLMPLVVTDAQMDEAMDVLEAALAHVTEKNATLSAAVHLDCHESSRHRATETQRKNRRKRPSRTGPIIGAAIEVHRHLGPGVARARL